MCYLRVLAVHPNHAKSLHELGVVVYQMGRRDRGVELIRQATRRDGRNPRYLLNLGNALKNQGELDDAIAAFRKAIVIKPDLAEAHFNLGSALSDQGRLHETIAAYRNLIAIDPKLAEAHANLGNALNALGRLDEAIAVFRKAIIIKPGLTEAHFNLGNALYDHGRLDEAIAAYREAIAINPELAPAHCNLGTALKDQGRIEEAIAACRRAVAITPDYAAAHYNLGNALKDHGKLDEAVAAYREAIAVKPDFGAAYANLGNVLNEQGRLDEAIAAYRRAIAIKPDAMVHSNLLLCLNYDDKSTSAGIFAEHREWNDRYGRQLSPPTAYANELAPERRLRIGYISPDFREHSVAYFMEPLLKGHDRQAVEVFCYADVTRPDMVTARLRGLVDHWLGIVGLSDDEMVERIRADGIDILVDLAGHTARNRLPLFARKPAPVQATWLGYPNTTGLEAIDYRLVDAVTDPAGEADAWASESLVRLESGFLCYGGLDRAPEPTVPPCLETGAVTFGSFNNPIKASAATLNAWGRLLSQAPKARLLLKGRTFGDVVARRLFLARLAERGVALDRVELVPWLPESAAHLALYDRIDIALDPFPYNGVTTTCEALWMGVPVVTLKGDRHAGRVGASLLTQIGLMDLIANSVEDYIEIAVTLAEDTGRLRDLRRSLRPRLAESPLCDRHAFARKIEVAYRAMWRRWCEAPHNR